MAEGEKRNVTQSHGVGTNLGTPKAAPSTKEVKKYRTPPLPVVSSRNFTLFDI